MIFSDNKSLTTATANDVVSYINTVYQDANVANEYYVGTYMGDDSLTARKKAFITLVGLGDYDIEKAVELLDPACPYPKIFARLLLTDEVVRKAMEKIIAAKNVEFGIKTSRARDRALSRTEFTMNTSNDEGIILRAADMLLKAAKDYSNVVNEGERQDGHVVFEFNGVQPTAVNCVQSMSADEIASAERSYQKNSPGNVMYAFENLQTIDSDDDSEK